MERERGAPQKRGHGQILHGSRGYEEIPELQRSGAVFGVRVHRCHGGVSLLGSVVGRSKTNTVSLFFFGVLFVVCGVLCVDGP